LTPPQLSVRHDVQRCAGPSSSRTTLDPKGVPKPAPVTMVGGVVDDIELIK
jgi:hypothetical protein